MKKTINNKKSVYLHQTLITMREKSINRLKAVLAEQNKTSKWLSQQLKKNETTISRWCTNDTQPSVENLIAIAKLLGVDAKDLLNPTKK